jgi:protein lifeguard
MVCSCLQRGGSLKKKGGSVANLLNSINEKKGFLAMVFSNLIVQLGITYFVMEHYGQPSSTSSSNNKNKKAQPPNKYVLIGVFLLQFAIIIALSLVSMPSWLKFILFSIFSALWGYALGNLQLDPKLVHMAIFGAMSIFGAMMVLGALLLTIGIQLGYQFVFILFMALLALIIFEVVLMFTGGYSLFIKAISMFSLGLFSLYVIYDTNRLLQRDYYGDFITASLDYYLDILNIFMDLINLGQN